MSMHSPDHALQLEDATRMLALVDACADTRDLEGLLTRAATVLLQCAQADLVAFALPPAATPHGPSIHVSSRSPMTALTERSVKEQTALTLSEMDIDPPPAEAFTLIKGTELTPLRAVARTDTVYPLWQSTLEFEGELVGVIIIYGYQDWSLAPRTQDVLEQAKGPLGRAMFQALALAQLRNRTHEDPLTGALNRRGFDEALRREVDRARRNRRELSLIMIDVDRFKEINDRCGHPAGDEVLIRLAARIQRTLRRSDFLCRVGGDELAVLLPEVAADVAHAVAERIAQACADITAGEAQLPVTMSMGVSGLSLAVGSPSDLVRRSDEALYAAKRGGRARVSRAG
jgi:diguanylate cyclase (GGDEF)-like protein